MAMKKQKEWSSPQCGWLKANVDAAIDISNQTAGLVIIITDW